MNVCGSDGPDNYRTLSVHTCTCNWKFDIVGRKTVKNQNKKEWKIDDVSGCRSRCSMD